MAITLKDIYFNNSPVSYIASDALIQAVEVAYALKRPLLLSGEPGTGKTEFARYVAYNLADKGFQPKPLLFNTKSSSIAQDLFYYYDAVAHFRSNNIADNVPVNAPKSTEDFIQLKALGLAYANAKGKHNLLLSSNIAAKENISDTPVGSVVLIDEIDKAPRDFPNDLLNEIEHYQFDIREINKSIQLDEEEKKRILVIMTSNFEKNLPEAFLRRCVYFHIEFPSPEDLQRIISTRLDISKNKLDGLKQRIDDFFIIRNDKPVQKKPSTAECIDFIRVVDEASLMEEPLFDKNKNVLPGSKILRFLPVLLKMKEDHHLFTANKNTSGA